MLWFLLLRFPITVVCSSCTNNCTVGVFKFTNCMRSSDCRLMEYDNVTGDANNVCSLLH